MIIENNLQETQILQNSTTLEDPDKGTLKLSDDSVSAHVSGILRPTLYKNDVLQSFVRIGIECDFELKESFVGNISMKSDNLNQFSASSVPRRLSRSWIEGNKDKSQRRLSVRFTKESIDNEIQIEMSRKKKGRRRSDVSNRQEEIYTDKDRAAAVNMGSRDIKQSLKMKRRQDQSRDLQIPEEAEPGAMLALGTREMKSGNHDIALGCIDKALKLSPGDKNVLIARSKCHLLLGNPQKALEDAEAAIRGNLKDPKNARAIFQKAEALYHLGDFELSLVYYYRGMRLRPELDQFRLGVQKAKEAIQNILGNSQPVSERPSTRKFESYFEGSTNIPRPKTSTSSRVSHTENTIKLSDKGSSRRVSSSINEKKMMERSHSGIAKKRNLKNLQLDQLEVDREYLENLLKNPVSSNTSDNIPAILL